MVVTTQNLPLEVSCLHMTMLLVKTQVVKQLRLRLSMHRGGALGRARCGPRHTFLHPPPPQRLQPPPAGKIGRAERESESESSDADAASNFQSRLARGAKQSSSPRYSAHWACLVVLCKWGSNPRPKFSFPQFSNP
jgi:hypothetical protein